MKGAPLVLTDVVNGEDVGMIQRRGGAGFLLEASKAIGISLTTQPEEL